MARFLLCGAIALVFCLVAISSNAQPKIRWEYNKSTGEFTQGGYFEPNIQITDPADAKKTIPDPAKGVVTLPRHPDPRTERYDGAGGIRKATQAEMDTYDAAVGQTNFNAFVDNTLVIKAVIQWIAKKHGLTYDQAKAEVYTEYQAVLP